MGYTEVQVCSQAASEGEGVSPLCAAHAGSDNLGSTATKR